MLSGGMRWIGWMGLFITSLIANCQLPMGADDQNMSSETATSRNAPFKGAVPKRCTSEAASTGTRPKRSPQERASTKSTLIGGASPLMEFLYQRIPSTEDTLKGACGKGAPPQKAHHQSGVQSSIQRAVNDSTQSPTPIPTFLRSPGRELSHA